MLMLQPSDSSRWSASYGNDSPSDQDQERELAYLFQNGQPGDPRLFELLGTYFGADLYRLIWALLPDKLLTSSASSLIDALAREVLVDAISQPQRFWGEPSLRNWLYALVWQHIKRRVHSPWNRFRQPRSSSLPLIQQNESEPIPSRESKIRTVMTTLPSNQRFVIILHYGHGRSPEDIHSILDLPKSKTIRYLNEARINLVAKGLEIPYPQGRVHRDVIEHFELNREKSNESDPNLPASIIEHSSTCPQCSAWLAGMKTLEQMLPGLIHRRWAAPLDISLAIVSSEAISIDPHPERGITFPHLAKSTIRFAWMGLLLIIFFAAVGILARFSPAGSDIPIRPTPSSAAIPDSIYIDPGSLWSTLRESSFDNQLIPYLDLQPAFSQDGRWIAISANIAGLPEYSQGQRPGLLLYDFQNQDFSPELFQDVGSSPDILQASPSLSAEGRYLAYSAVLDAGPSEKPPCQEKLSGEPCQDIFVMDRATDRLLQVTQGHDGAPANGGSYKPVLSGDGRYVAFWSSADNLKENDEFFCETKSEDKSCFDLFIYDFETKTIEHIPIGPSEPFDEFSIQKVSLSMDGRYLALSIFNNDNIANNLGVKQSVQAFVYDRLTQEFESLDIASDGSQGNAPSFSPVLSADGNFAAFVSHSTNLVEGDTNQVADIFVRDRQQGRTERVSLTSTGSEAVAPSGLVSIDQSIKQSNATVSLSSDGRYVAFLSHAANLFPGIFPRCRQTARENLGCNGVYLFDRETKKIILIAPPDDRAPYQSVNISGNGRWIVYSQNSPDCFSIHGFCADIILYDQQRDWHTSIIQKNLKGGGQVWEPFPILNEDIDPSGILAISPDSRLIATTSTDGSISVWNSDDESVIFKEKPNEDTSYVTLTFSPDNELLAAGLDDGTVMIWRLPYIQPIYTLEGHPEDIQSLLFSPDGTRLFVSAPEAIWIWRIDDHRMIRENILEYSEGLVNAMAVSPSGEILAVANQDHTVWLQKIPSGDILLRLGGHEVALDAVAYSPDGQLLAARSRDGLINLWKIQTTSYGNLDVDHQDIFRNDGNLGILAFTSDGHKLVTGNQDNKINFWDVGSRRPSSFVLEQLNEPIESLAFSAQTDVMVVNSQDRILLLRQSTAIRNPLLVSRGNLDDYLGTWGPPIPITLEVVRQLKYLSTWQNMYFSPYQLESELGYDLFVPTKFPATITYKGAWITTNSKVVFNYAVSQPNRNSPGALLLLMQEPYSPSLPRPVVGNNARVEKVSDNTLYGEYITGDWVSIQNQPPDSLGVAPAAWHWDGQIPVQRLVWVKDQMRFTLHYFPVRLDYPDAPFDINGMYPFSYSEFNTDISPVHRSLLTKSELIAIASSLSRLENVNSQEIEYWKYIVQSGDTCFAIAQRYNTSVAALTTVNQLSNDCNMIYIGQELLIPLPTERISILEGNYTCDGTTVRLNGIPLTQPDSSSVYLGLTLEKLSDIGIFEEIWQFTAIEDGELAYVTLPSVFKLSGCRYFLAFEVVGGVEAGLKIFSFSEDSLNLELSADGWVLDRDTIGGNQSTIATVDVELIPNSSACKRTITEYTWDGFKFIISNRLIEEQSHCTRG